MKRRTALRKEGWWSCVFSARLASLLLIFAVFSSSISQDVNSPTSAKLRCSPLAKDSYRYDHISKYTFYTSPRAPDNNQTDHRQEISRNEQYYTVFEFPENCKVNVTEVGFAQPNGTCRYSLFKSTLMNNQWLMSKEAFAIENSSYVRLATSITSNTRFQVIFQVSNAGNGACAFPIYLSATNQPFIAVVVEDIDECNHNPCNAYHDSGTCVNQFGSFSCNCSDGFTRNGQSCIRLNGCNDEEPLCRPYPGLATGRCMRDNASTYCLCFHGYENIAERTTCIDTDECIHRACNPYPGVNSGQCANSQGSYTCTCFSGFASNASTCTDVDECSDDGHGCDVDNANRITCHNTVGSYQCLCSSGFTGPHCTDAPTTGSTVTSTVVASSARSSSDISDGISTTVITPSSARSSSGISDGISNTGITSSTTRSSSGISDGISNTGIAPSGTSSPATASHTQLPISPNADQMTSISRSLMFAAAAEATIIVLLIIAIAGIIRKHRSSRGNGSEVFNAGQEDRGADINHSDHHAAADALATQLPGDPDRHEYSVVRLTTLSPAQEPTLQVDSGYAYAGSPAQTTSALPAEGKYTYVRNREIVSTSHPTPATSGQCVEGGDTQDNPSRQAVGEHDRLDRVTHGADIPTNAGFDVIPGSTSISAQQSHVISSNTAAVCGDAADQECDATSRVVKSRDISNPSAAVYAIPQRKSTASHTEHADAPVRLSPVDER